MKAASRITVRVITCLSPWAVIEADGKELASASLREPEEVMKAFELALTAAGYAPDLDRMYIDDSLMVLKLDKRGDEANADRSEDS